MVQKRFEWKDEFNQWQAEYICPYCKKRVNARNSWTYTKKKKGSKEYQYHLDCLRLMLSPEEYVRRMRGIK